MSITASLLERVEKERAAVLERIEERFANGLGIFGTISEIQVQLELDGKKGKYVSRNLLRQTLHTLSVENEIEFKYLDLAPNRNDARRPYRVLPKESVPA